MTAQLIGSVTLRTQHRIYDDGTRYLIESSVRKDPGRTHTQPVSREAVQHVETLRQQGLDTIDDITFRIRDTNVRSLGFEYSYGYQLNYEVQRALVVLVALRRAVVQPRGRGFVFSSHR